MSNKLIHTDTLISVSCTLVVFPRGGSYMMIYARVFVGQRHLIVTLRSIGPKCGQIDVSLPAIGHECVSINRLCHMIV